jgi:vacuolar-type H+-ATPase subunit I/STV1
MPTAAWTGAREALAARAASQQANAVHLKDVARARKTEHQRTTRREDKTMAQRTSIGAGELTSVQQLLAEIRGAAPRLEQLHTELTELGEWVSGLPERYVAAEFGTKAITDGVGAVAETNPAAADQVIVQLTEALQALYGAAREAEIVTEAADTVQAEGNLSGFRGE